jgi:hypothetical protein
MHPPPLVDDPLLDVLLPELDDGAWQVPALQVPVVAPPIVQSLHSAAPVPHVVSDDVWQVFALSQHPIAQLVMSHVDPPLLLVLVPLELVELPPSSPLLLVLDVEDALPDELL